MAEVVLLRALSCKEPCGITIAEESVKDVAVVLVLGNTVKLKVYAVIFCGLTEVLEISLCSQCRYKRYTLEKLLAYASVTPAREFYGKVSHILRA